MSVDQLDGHDFAHFFEALHGNTPFDWQHKLVQYIFDQSLMATEQAWPEIISLPTGFGKTACVDIAIFTLAALHGMPNIVPPPRRIFFVVDRRVIVDSVYERAQHIAKYLSNAQSGILKTVADRLRRMSSGGVGSAKTGTPLEVHVLRGGMYKSETWASNPLQPIVVASTVDQIGSRLLFHAYGRSCHVWPVYAGLTVNDSLIILDEAHCANPFLQTLRAIRHFRTHAKSPLNTPFQCSIMSATPPDYKASIFLDSSAERHNPKHPLGMRCMASKPAKLALVKKPANRDRISAMAEALAKAARERIDGGQQAVVVFANYVSTARKTHNLLQSTNYNAVLLTGRMRQVDKDWVASRLRPLYSNGTRSGGPVVVVATQTLEVGADLDFDDLVTECAPLDALRQRFGRLNRTGRDILPQPLILIRDDYKKHEDSIYAKTPYKTWAWLNERLDSSNTIDFGINNLDAMLPKLNAELNAPSETAPIMLPAHIDCWAQTSPRPFLVPDIGQFLHGPAKQTPDVQVCWRAGMNLYDKEETIQLLRMCPPNSAETVTVPFRIFMNWFGGESSSAQNAEVDTDVEGDSGYSEPKEFACPTPVVRWRGADTVLDDVTVDGSSIRPGDVIVIPVGQGEELGDIPPDASRDVGDRTHRIVRGKAILRIHHDIVNTWPELARLTSIKDLLSHVNMYTNSDEQEEFIDLVQQTLEDLASVPASKLRPNWEWLPKSARDLLNEYGNNLDKAVHIIGEQNIVIVGRLRKSAASDISGDEDDADASGNSRHPVKLLDHLYEVEKMARHYATGSGMPTNVVDAIGCAGLLHDLGKSDPRFQSWLRGGALWYGGEILAKSQMPTTRKIRERSRIAAGYPTGGRHELLSVRMAESVGCLLPNEPIMRDLALHLIASHHGRCRPFSPVVDDTVGADAHYAIGKDVAKWSGPTELEMLDSGVAERYWRLTEYFGWWGLAWMEAALRLADWKKSGEGS